MSHRTLTITLDSRLTRRLRRLDDAQLSRLIENYLRTYGLTEAEIDAEYAAMAADEEREREAIEWIEFAPNEGLEDIDDDWSWLKEGATTDTKGDVGV
jgi:hypothetical protein